MTWVLKTEEDFSLRGAVRERLVFAEGFLCALQVERF